MHHHLRCHYVVLDISERTSSYCIATSYGDNTDQQSLSDGACRFGRGHLGVLKASVPVGCLVQPTDEGYRLCRSPRAQANMTRSF